MTMYYYIIRFDEKAIGFRTPDEIMKCRHKIGSAAEAGDSIRSIRRVPRIIAHLYYMWNDTYMSEHA